MSDHADTIREALESDWMYGGPSREVFAALDALVAENQELRDALELAEDYIPCENFPEYLKRKRAALDAK